MSGKMFNRLLANNFINGEKMMPNVRRLAEETANAVRQRFGIRGLPDDVKIGDIASHDDILRTADEVSVGGRATVEDMREGFIQSALKRAVRRIANSAVRDYLASIGHDIDDALPIASCMINRHPEVVTDLTAARSPDEVEAIIGRYAGIIEDCTRIYGEVETACAGVLDRVRLGLANKLGMSLEEIRNVQIELYGIERKADDYSTSICNGNPPLNTMAEFRQAFDDLADAYVAERIKYLDAVDALKGLSPDVKNDIKVVLLTIQNVKDIKLEFLLSEARKIAPMLGGLETALRGPSTPNQVFGAMRPVAAALRTAVGAMLDGKDEIGPDDLDAPTFILAQMAMSMRPGMTALLEAFYARQDVKDALKSRGMDSDNPAYASITFENFSIDPQINPAVGRNANVKQVFA